MPTNALDVNLGIRKELYGRRVVKLLNQASGKSPAGTVIRGIVCDSHYSDDQGAHHQPCIILTIEHEGTGRIMHWNIPVKIDSPDQWDDYPYVIYFDKLDVETRDMEGLKIGGYQPSRGELMELMEDWDMENNPRLAKGRVR